MKKPRWDSARRSDKVTTSRKRRRTLNPGPPEQVLVVIRYVIKEPPPGTSEVADSFSFWGSETVISKLEARPDLEGRFLSF